MVLMGVLCLLVAAGLVAVWRWGHVEIVAPWTDDVSWPLAPREALTRYIWYVTIAIVAGIVSGVVMMGAGGRLAMRLLAITAGAAAQGRVTEAEQVVGQITLDGTLGFMTFFGIFGGVLLGLLYMVIRRWLPRGRWGGVTFGLFLLVLFATRVEPLRADNPDFDIVGPGWLAVTVFVALALAQGMLLAALTGRYSRSLPTLKRDLRTLAMYAPLILLAPAFFLMIPLTVVGLLAMLAARTQGLDRILAAPRFLSTGRVAGVLLAAIAAPGFVSAIVDIGSR